MSLQEAKANGVKTVMLNGWRENIEYVMTLSNVEWSCEVKSEDGYSVLQCYISN